MGDDALAEVCELAFDVAKDGLDELPPIAPPPAMRSFLYLAHRPPRAYSVARRALLDDPEFRARVAARADDLSPAGRAWLDELASSAGDATTDQQATPPPTPPPTSPLEDDLARLRPSDDPDDADPGDGDRSETTDGADPVETTAGSDPVDDRDPVARVAAAVGRTIPPSPTAPSSTAAGTDDIQAELADLRSLVGQLTEEREAVDTAARTPAPASDRPTPPIPPPPPAARPDRPAPGGDPDDLRRLAGERDDAARRAGELERALVRADEVATRNEEARAAAERDLAEVRRRLDEAERELAEARHRIEVADDRRAEAERAVASAEERMATVEADLVESRRRLTEAERALAESKATRRDLERDLADERRARRQAESRRNEAEQQRLEVSSAATAAEARIHELEATRTAEDEERATLLADNIQLAKHLKAALDAKKAAPDPEGLRRENQRLQDDNRALAERIVATERRLEELTSSERTVAALADEIAELRSQLDDARTAPPVPPASPAEPASPSSPDSGGRRAPAWVAASVEPAPAEPSSEPDDPAEPATDAADDDPSTAVPARTRTAVPADIEPGSVEEMRAVATTPDVVLLVDGDGVAELGWPHLDVAARRGALVSYLAELTAETGAAADVVFTRAVGGEESLPVSRSVRVRIAEDDITTGPLFPSVLAGYPEEWPIAVVTDEPVLVDRLADAEADLLENGQLLDLFLELG